MIGRLYSMSDISDGGDKIIDGCWTCWTCNLERPETGLLYIIGECVSTKSQDTVEEL